MKYFDRIAYNYGYTLYESMNQIKDKKARHCHETL